MNSPQTIKDKLSARGINQQSIATVLGCDLSTVHCTIYGKRTNLRIAATIAAILGEPVNNLFSHITPEPKPRKPKPPRTPKVTPEEVEALRVIVCDMLAQNGRLSRTELARQVSEFTGRHINMCILSMTLTGSRNKRAAFRLLQDLRAMLTAPKDDITNDFTHN